MRYYLWELRPCFRQVAGQLTLGSLCGIAMNTVIVLPAILLGRAIDAVPAASRGEGTASTVAWAALAGMERIGQVLAMPTEAPPAASHPSNVRVVETSIALEAVTFGYQPDYPVLHGISLTVRRGQHVGLVGRTGAGKTSILHLVGGLYSPWSGAVRIAGIDPLQLDEGERRHIVGFVPQAVQLFRGTVLDNLTLGDASIGREAARHAATIAGADALISVLPQGYDTPLARGLQLSLGQQQLLTLARGLVGQPAVLLLDEATAAIDSVSEAAFRSALRAAVATSGCAVLTVAHRLSTAREADPVVVIEDGRIIEQGPPSELARAGGWFAAMLALEEAGWDWRVR